MPCPLKTYCENINKKEREADGTETLEEKCDMIYSQMNEEEKAKLLTDAGWEIN